MDARFKVGDTVYFRRNTTPPRWHPGIVERVDSVAVILRYTLRVNSVGTASSLIYYKHEFDLCSEEEAVALTLRNEYQP